MNVLDSLLARARVDPPGDSRRLLIAGHACGWVACDVLHWLEAFPEVTIAADRVHLLPDLGRAAPPNLDDVAKINDLLDRIACALRDGGRLNGWRDELLDVIADDGTLLGMIERAAVRPLGIATYAVHLNAWTESGLAWIARRSLTKTTDPGKWDTLVGGLISAGETPEIALARESWEEAGLLPRHLKHSVRRGHFRVRRILPEGYQVEHVTVVDVVLARDVVPENQDGEVIEMKAVTCDSILDLAGQDAITLEAAMAWMVSCRARSIALNVSTDALEAVSL